MSTTPDRRSIRSPARCTCATSKRWGGSHHRRRLLSRDYLKPVGVLLAAQHGDAYVAAPEDQWLPLFRDAAIKAMIELIRHDLGLLGIHHDLFSSEAELQQSGRSTRRWTSCGKGLVFEGTLERPKSLDEHDEREPVELTLSDDPVRRRPGSADEEVGRQLSYSAPTPPTTGRRRKRADHLVNIWGADHAGTVKRVQAAVTRADRRQGRSRREAGQHGAPVQERRTSSR